MTRGEGWLWLVLSAGWGDTAGPSSSSKTYLASSEAMLSFLDFREFLDGLSDQDWYVGHPRGAKDPAVTRYFRSEACRLIEII
jgi:hypothetical protein